MNSLALNTDKAKIFKKVPRSDWSISPAGFSPAITGPSTIDLVRSYYPVEGVSIDMIIFFHYI